MRSHHRHRHQGHRRTGALLVAVTGLLVACGGESTERPVEAPAPAAQAAIGPSPTGNADAVNTLSPVGTGRETVPEGERAWAATKLDVRVRLHRAEVERGHAVMARIELHNLGQEPLVLISPEELLKKRLHLRVTSRGRDIDLTSAHPPDDSPREFLLPSAQMVAADVDLLPLLRNTLAYEEGRVRFAAVYDGAADLLPESLSAWNREGDAPVVSAPVVVDVVEPRWRADLGAERQDVGDLSNLMVAWRPGAPNTDRVKKEIAARGDAGVRALFHIVSRMDSTRHEVQLRANRALELLLLVAPQAAEVARGLAAADAPAVAMARDLVLAEAASLSQAQPSRTARIVSSLATGDAEGGWLSVDMVGTERLPPEHYLLDGSGRLTVERRGAGGGRRARALPPAELRELCDALLATRPWLWRNVRNRRLSGEGTVSIRFSVAGKTEFEVVLPEGEALDANPLARRLLDAFGAFADRVGAR